MIYSEAPKVIYEKIKKFEEEQGRKATEEERRDIVRRVKKECDLQRTKEKYGITDNVTYEDIKDMIEYENKLRESRVMRERELEYRLIHGIPEDKAKVALNTFMESVPERYKNASLSDFNEGATIVDHLLNGGSCLLTGSVGCGKTRLIYAICKRLCLNYSPGEVVVNTLSGLISSIHENSGTSDWLDYTNEKYCKQTKLLCIDEFDKCKFYKSDFEIINHIANERYNNQFQTVVVGKGDLTKAVNILGEAVVSRLTGRADGGRHFQQDGKDRRQ